MDRQQIISCLDKEKNRIESHIQYLKGRQDGIDFSSEYIDIMNEFIKSLKQQIKNLPKEMGRRGGKIGGVARALVLSPERRKEIATIAAQARWGNK